MVSSIGVKSMVLFYYVWTVNWISTICYKTCENNSFILPVNYSTVLIIFCSISNILILEIDCWMVSSIGVKSIVCFYYVKTVDLISTICYKTC